MAGPIDEHDPLTDLTELLQRADPVVVVESDFVTVSLRTPADMVHFGSLIEALAYEESGVVARAAEAAYLAAHCYDCLPWDKADRDTRQLWIRAARAALALVREP